MNDMQLLTFGAAVSFITIAGAYVFLRERYLAALRAEKVRVEAERKPERERRLRRAA